MPSLPLLSPFVEGFISRLSASFLSEGSWVLTNWTLLSRRDRANAWWSIRLWVRKLHPIFIQDIAWKHVVIINPTNKFRDSNTFPGFYLRSHCTGGLPSRLLARHQTFHKYHGILFSRSPQSYHSLFYCCVFQVLENLQECLPTVRVEDVGEL